MDKNSIKSKISAELFYMLYLLSSPGDQKDLTRHLRSSMICLEYDIKDLDKLSGGKSNE